MKIRSQSYNFKADTPFEIPLSFRPDWLKHNLRLEAYEFNYELTEAVFFKVQKEKLYSFLKNRIGEECAIMLVKKVLYFDTLPIARSIIRIKTFKKMQPKKSEQIYSINISDKVLGKYLRSLDLCTEYNKDYIFTLTTPSIGNYAQDLIRLFANIFILIYNWFILSFIKVPHSSKKKMALEIHQGSNIYFKRSEMNWIEDSTDDLSYLVGIDLGCGEYDYLDDEELSIMENMKKKGMTFLSDSRKFSKFIGQMPIKSTFIKKISFLSFGRSWISQSIMSWISRYFFWKMILEKLNISLFHFVNEDNINSVLIRAILDKKSGMTIGRAKSEIPYNTGMCFHPFHIMSFWSELRLEDYVKSQNQIEAFAITGHTYIKDLDRAKINKMAGDFRDDLIKSGAEVIITFFDNIHNMETDISTVEMKDLVHFLVRLIKENPKIGILYKCKKQHFLGALIDAPSLRLLEESGRFKICYGNILPHIFSLAADLSIGVGISSAALEGHILNKPTVYFYPGPLEDFPPNSETGILFSTISDLVNFIKNFARDKNFYPREGLDIANHFDEYRDGKSHYYFKMMVNEFLENEFDSREEYYLALKSKGIKLIQRSGLVSNLESSEVLS